MKKEFLEGLGLSEDQIKSIQAENGKDIENAKAKFADYEDLKTQLENAKGELEKFKDVKPDELNAKIKELTENLATQKKESEAKLLKMEKAGLVKDYLSGKKFVNEFTRDFVSKSMADALDGEDAKGKSLDDIFKAITEGKENILVDENKPTPPKTLPLGGDPKDELADENAARAIMGLPPKK